MKLDGNVGIIGNGAGLVMSTLDLVAQAGAKAANFLDVGGGASADQMATSLEVVRVYRAADAREFLAEKGLADDEVDGRFASAFVRGVKPSSHKKEKP